jgi:acetylornithine deacetylase/succinyl-diaminopimelate desuccinylase-like protein
MVRKMAPTVLALTAVAMIALGVTTAGRARAAEPDWAAAEAELEAILAELVAIDTHYPPGNEVRVCEALRARLEREGIGCQIVEPESTRGSLVARLPGSGKKRPLLVMGHTDVVGVDPEAWSMDPFQLTERDGFYYGRGVIDDKGMVAAEALVLLLLKRSGVELSRDVIFLAEADEESGGKWGIEWLLAHRRELVDAEFALNEGGRIALKDGKVAWVGLQSAEKRSVSLDLTARGTSGHGSVPRPDNAVARLARAIDRIQSASFPMKLTPETRAFLSAVAPTEEPMRAAAMRELADSKRGQDAAAIVSEDLVYNAMLHNTISPTMLEAGIKSNVIPSTAKGTINVRLLPGEDLDAFLAQLETIIDDDGIEISYHTTAPNPEAPSSPFEGTLVDAVRAASERHFPGAAVVPLLSTGATDSADLRRAGIPAYGLLIFPLTLDDAARMHGDEERMPVESLGKGLRLLYDVVVEAAR